MFLAGEFLIDVVSPDSIHIIVHRHHVDAFARVKPQLPSVDRHTCDHVVLCQCPRSVHAAVFHPYIFVVFGKSEIHLGILHKDGRMRPSVVMHDTPLVVDDILHGQSG